jgi:hypothetical protein
VNALRYDDGSRKYVTLGEYQEKRKRGKPKKKPANDKVK